MNKETQKSSSCNYLIIVDISNIPVAERSQWNTDNQQYFNSTPIGFKAEIDPSKIAAADLAKWLYDNQAFINYNDSYEYIECVHVITATADLKQFEDSPEICQMLFSELISKIEDADVDFSNPGYDKYAALSVEGVKIVVNSAPTFNTNDFCYSVPFFKSILHNNSAITTSSTLTFKKPTTHGALDGKLCFSVSNGTTIIKNYDFSQEPP